MWLVGKGRLKLKVEQCRNDTPEAISDLIRQCTEFDREKRPNFAPEVCLAPFSRSHLLGLCRIDR